jgi:hypothetical protein
MRSPWTSIPPRLKAHPLKTLTAATAPRIRTLCCPRYPTALDARGHLSSVYSSVSSPSLQRGLITQHRARQAAAGIGRACKAVDRRATLLCDILSDAADGSLLLPSAPHGLGPGPGPGLAESHLLRQASAPPPLQSLLGSCSSVPLLHPLLTSASSPPSSPSRLWLRTRERETETETPRRRRATA